MQLPGERLGSGVLGAVDADVGPFVEQGAVEAFNLAVPGRPSGWETTVARADGFDGCSEGVGDIAGPVGGLEHVDADSEVCEPGVSAGPERDRGAGALVTQDFAVGEAAVTVDRSVNEREADTVPDPTRQTVGPPSTTAGDPPELLDVHLDQLAGTGLFDAAPDHRAGGPVHPRQAVQPQTAQHSVHGRGCQLEDPRDAGRPQLAGPAQGLNATLQAPRGAVRAA